MNNIKLISDQRRKTGSIERKVIALTIPAITVKSRALHGGEFPELAALLSVVMIISNDLEITMEVS